MKSFPAYSLLFATITAGAAPLQAQSRLTFLGGYSTARMVATLGDGAVSRMPVHGFVPGVGITIGLSDRVGITAEALYVRKGYSTVTLEPGTQTVAATSRLDVRYADLPLLLTARYPFGKAQLVVLGGATLALRLKCSATITQSDGSRSGNDCIDTDSGVIVPATDLAITAGFGIAWHRFSLTGQYELTGRDIPAFSPGVALQHRTLIVMLGIDALKGRGRG